MMERVRKILGEFFRLSVLLNFLPMQKRRKIIKFETFFGFFKVMHKSWLEIDRYLKWNQDVPKGW